MTRALQRLGTHWRSVLCSRSASLALHPSGRGWGRWQRVVNHGDRSDSCRSKKLRLWDKALHPSHLGGSSFSLALLVGVATPTAGAWSAACESVQALHLLLGCKCLLATIWLHWKQAERRISCKATVKFFHGERAVGSSSYSPRSLQLLFKEVHLHAFSPCHFPTELIQAQTRFSAWHSESCIISVLLPSATGNGRLKEELRDMGFALSEVLWKSCQACWIDLVKKGRLFSPLKDVNSLTPQ